MTTALDTALRGVALNVLAGLGTAVTIRRVTAGTYSTTSGGGTDTTADTTCQAAMRGVKNSEVMGLVQMGDRVLTVAASALTNAPRPQDKALIGTSLYQIIEVREQRARDLAVQYKLFVRGPIA